MPVFKKWNLCISTKYLEQCFSLFGFSAATKVLWHFFFSPLGIYLVYQRENIWGREGGRLRRFPAKSDSSYGGSFLEFEECGGGKRIDKVHAHLERRAEKMSVLNLFHLRDVSMEIRWVLRNLIYWRLRPTH